MGKSEIKDLLQAEIQLFQVFSFFLVGTITGFASIVLTEGFENKLISIFLLVVDFIALVYTGIVCSLQLIRINKLKYRLN
jgi:hypothetical protein